MFNRIIYLLIIILISVTSTNAAVIELNISPDNPVVGDIITISGVASPGESIDTEVSFTKSVTVSGEFYSYNINSVVIPSGSNSFTVIANGINDLYVDIKMGIWISKSTSATDTIATLSEYDLPAGTYDVKIYGVPASGVSTVLLKIDGTKIIVADSDGNFEYNYNTDTLPVGNFNLNVGDMSRTITLSAPDIKSSSGGSSGGGGGGTAEANENIECFEIDRQFISTNSAINYNFNLECNIVDNINFTGITTSGTIVGKVEILKNTSTLVKVAPPDIVFKNLNIWLGFADWATDKNMANVTINFKVDKSWIAENSIDISTITLYRYSEDKWSPLATSKTSEDLNYFYFLADTPGFSPFVITGQKKLAVDLQPTTNIVPEQSDSILNNASSSESEIKTQKAIPGFEILIGLISILIIIYFKRNLKY